ncbi:MAG: DUF1223 domain-containing protein [Proteobacteria bacterium]|nr:DUF1223 domain-containing protein [Pseudomonadota bacterium]MDA1059814.1 DUF1223 domain-containing protein [Pseudomonadota bacterium]
MAFWTWKTFVTGGVIAVVIGVAALSPAERAPAQAASSGKPVVIELFTSQSCYSCPAAEAYLGELIEDRDDVIALEWHVDYWDRLVHGGSAWKDVFSDAAFTERQRIYATQLKGRGYSYTPQMVIDGKREAVGSNRSDVSAAIRDLAGEVRLAVSAQTRPDGMIDITVDGPAEDTAAAIWIVTYLKSHVTDVAGGENKGKTLANNYIVRRMERVGDWTGTRVAISAAVTLEAGHGCVVLVQTDAQGPVLGAARCADAGAARS